MYSLKKYCEDESIKSNEVKVIETSNGTKIWLQNGKIHNEDGPAIELPDGTKTYWLNDVGYTKEGWKKEKNKIITERFEGRLDSKSQRFLDDLLNFEDEDF